jgi:hypothetical protein
MPRIRDTVLLVLTVTWVVWAYTPDWVLQSLSITYYPDRCESFFIHDFYLRIVYGLWYPVMLYEYMCPMRMRSCKAWA